MKFLIESNNLEDTLALGQMIGKALRGGEVIELKSDLGGGKTALTKGIAAGMGSKDTVQSPSFTISRIYRCKDNLELHHFDFYRLDDPGIMAAELAESLDTTQVAVAIEWGDIVADILPKEHIEIHIAVYSEMSRRITITVPAQFMTLVDALHRYTSENFQ